MLGIDFTARLGSVDRQTQASRIDSAKLRINRIKLFPVSSDRRAGFIASLAIPKAIWGAWTAFKPLGQLLAPVKQTAGGQHCCASSPLFFLLSKPSRHWLLWFGPDRASGLTGFAEERVRHSESVLK